MCKKDPLMMVSWVLVLVGAINWGLVGAFGIDLVNLILGGVPMLAKIVYILVGLSGVYQLVKCCGSGNCKTS